MVGGAVHGPAETPVTGAVVTDSREIEPGSLFVAIRGEQVDGHDYAARALDAGAVLVLAERPLTGTDGAPLPTVVVPDATVALGALAAAVLRRLRERDGSRPRVVAMTGSVGKTTTKDLLASVLGHDGPTVAPVRSFNNEVGLPVTVLRCTEETATLVLEMGASGPGHIRYLTDIAAPDVAAVLTVGSAHLGGFGGVEGIARAKSEIVTGLAPGGTAVLNADDPRVAAMAPLAERVVTFGRTPSADVVARDLEMVDGARARFTIVDRRAATGDDGDDAALPAARLTLALVGEHHVTNALAAAAVALECGVPLDEVASRLEIAGAGSPHRMAVTELTNGVTVIDDSYNANPESMRAALKALVALAASRRTIAVLGEMRELGEDSLTEHDALGRLAVRLDVSRLVVVGAGARAMYTGALLEGSFGEEALFVADIDEAQTWLTENAAPGDVVLLKSSNGSGLHLLADRLLGDAR
ncbi:UDP-N-acetylmuramoyl-tripeptide--D-alanyl-D-alanine ligase [Serinibacter arcticus]|nr:UDP-N-acetylmuramoyl-tripeptide--D-alanyl-D-alanine ligase [Serinibacter arcticus]